MLDRTGGARSLDGYLKEQKRVRVTVRLCNVSFVRWCNGFCPRLVTRMFRDRASCEGVCHCQSFVHQTNTAPFAGQSDTCGTDRAQLSPSVMRGRATVFFSQSSIMIHVFYWNPAQQKCWFLRRFVSFARPAEGLVRREAGWARARAAGRRPVALPTSSASPPCRRRYCQKSDVLQPVVLDSVRTSSSYSTH